MDTASGPTLLYNGTTYRFTQKVAADLEARGVIVRDTSDGADYALSLEHTVDEIDDLGEIEVRTDVPAPTRLRMFDRNGGLFRASWLPRRLYTFVDKDQQR